MSVAETDQDSSIAALQPITNEEYTTTPVFRNDMHVASGTIDLKQNTHRLPVDDREDPENDPVVDQASNNPIDRSKEALKSGDKVKHLISLPDVRVTIIFHYSSYYVVYATPCIRFRARAPCQNCLDQSREMQWEAMSLILHHKQTFAERRE